MARSTGKSNEFSNFTPSFLPMTFPVCFSKALGGAFKHSRPKASWCTFTTSRTPTVENGGRR